MDRFLDPTWGQCRRTFSVLDLGFQEVRNAEEGRFGVYIPREHKSP
jgi:hypothetical protein